MGFAQMDAAEFQDFLASVGNWDHDNATALFRLVEPELRRKIRANLCNGHLRRAVDSGDIFQSVLLKFLVQMAERKFEIDNAAKLKALLWTMALNRIRDLARQERPVTNEYPSDFLDPGSSPSGRVSRDELIAQLRERLSPESLRIHRWRSEGLTWTEIGDRLQKPPPTVRVRFAREVEKITGEMGLEASE
jgi:RNA polymerase sigma factor (sigma-70 family)